MLQYIYLFQCAFITLYTGLRLFFKKKKKKRYVFYIKYSWVFNNQVKKINDNR